MALRLRGMGEREYIIFCDESDKDGAYYSNFYGGLIVGGCRYEKVTNRLNALKSQLNVKGEVKWQKVAEAYLPKYQRIISAFFDEVAAGRVRVRIMFHQNARKAVGLTPEQIGGRYYLLYYQFIKHAFGLQYMPRADDGLATYLRLYFDQFPDTGEQVELFKGYIHALQMSLPFRKAGLSIRREDIAEVRSHDHVLLQCLDVVLGAMTFRLNNKHREKPPGQRCRGARTRAKERLYKDILQHIRRLRPGFNIGITTGHDQGGQSRWLDPYRHWAFQPADADFDKNLTKGRRR